MRAYIISLLGSGSDADDILQESNLFLCERWTDYQPGTSFKSWAFRVAYFKTLAHRRDQLHRDRIEFSESTLFRIAERGQELFGEGPDRLEALRQCLAELGETERTMLDICYTKGCSLTKLAQEGGKSITAIHKAVSRLRFTLRRCVEHHLSSR